MGRVCEAIAEGCRFGLGMAIAVVLVSVAFGVGLSLMAWIIGIPLREWGCSS